MYDQALRMRLPESGGDERKEDNAESTNQHGNHGNWNEYDCRSLSPTHAVSSHDEEDIEYNAVDIQCESNDAAKNRDQANYTTKDANWHVVQKKVQELSRQKNCLPQRLVMSRD